VVRPTVPTIVLPFKITVKGAPAARRWALSVLDRGVDIEPIDRLQGTNNILIGVIYRHKEFFLTLRFHDCHVTGIQRLL
jgi:hypothetical protein